MSSIVCTFCGLRVQTSTPRGGDGSVEVLHRHLARDGVNSCEGSRLETDLLPPSTGAESRDDR